MTDEKMILTSQAIDLSEKEDERYITLTNRLCYYDEPNLNGVVLPSSNAEELAKTLIDMPVVAKYKKNILGEDDLGGHEMSIKENGEVEWGTESIGVHKSVEVKSDTVEINGEKKELPCLFATAKIWTRNNNVVNAIKRLYSENGLFTSWEITTKSCEIDDETGIRTLTDYEFTSNCCLGSNCVPAYGSTSKTLNVASVEPKYLIAEALEKDMKVGEEMVENTNLNETEVSESQTNETENNQEKSEKELTSWDIQCKLSDLYRNSHLNDWGYVSYFYPAGNYALFKTESCENELDFIKVEYAIENNEVKIANEIPVSLTIDYNTAEETLRLKDEKISSQADGLVKANQTIEDLKKQLSELEPIKVAYEKAEQEKKEKLLAEAREKLTRKIISSGLFTEEEINSDEFKGIISELEEDKINSLIAERFLQKIEIQKEIETSEFQGLDTIRIDTSIDEGASKFSIAESEFSVVELFNVRKDEK